MSIEDFILKCDNDILIGIYPSGAEAPIEEFTIPETTGRAERDRIIRGLTSKYPGVYVGSFWIHNEDTIAANCGY